jgi:secondary thiamine-phosphate synthase enzyme
LEIRTHTITLATRGFNDVRDLTPHLLQQVREAGLREGSILVFVGGATAGVTTIEFESGVVTDLKEAIERLAPRDIPYAHDARWGDGNGFAHVRAALVHADLEIPVASGKLLLGTWQQVVLCDFDNRPRERRVICQLRGLFDRPDPA